MAVYKQCEGPGCLAGTGITRKDCLVCGGSAWVRSDEVPPEVAPAEESEGEFPHKWRYFAPSEEPAVMTAFWSCTKCGAVSSGRFPGLAGCDVDEDPVEIPDLPVNEAFGAD